MPRVEIVHEDEDEKMTRLAVIILLNEGASRGIKEETLNTMVGKHLVALYEAWHSMAWDGDQPEERRVIIWKQTGSHTHAVSIHGYAERNFRRTDIPR